MADTNFTVTIRGVLRTLTINQDYQYDVSTSTLSTDCDAVGTAIYATISGGSLTAKSFHGHLSFASTAARQARFGGQTTYHTEYDTATPTNLNRAVANTVEPEHRTAFALDEVDLASANAISAKLQSIVKQAWYQVALYTH